MSGCHLGVVPLYQARALVAFRFAEAVSVPRLQSCESPDRAVSAVLLCPAAWAAREGHGAAVQTSWRLVCSAAAGHSGSFGTVCSAVSSA